MPTLMRVGASTRSNDFGRDPAGGEAVVGQDRGLLGEGDGEPGVLDGLAAHGAEAARVVLQVEATLNKRSPKVIQ